MIIANEKMVPEEGFEAIASPQLQIPEKNKIMEQKLM